MGRFVQFLPQAVYRGHTKTLKSELCRVLPNIENSLQ